MSAFEFVFSLFGLLLGFSLVEVLGGLAKAVEAKLRPAAPGTGPFRIGWLTPLLAMFVMLDLVSFWRAAWLVREKLSVSGAVLLAGLFFAGSYYFAAHLIFPPDMEAERDLDTHFHRVKRFVLGVVLTLFACQMVYWASAFPVYFAQPFSLFWMALFVGLLAAAMVVRNRTASVIVLSLMIAQYLAEYLLLN